MKLLTVDIETMPHLGYFWDRWKQDINMIQIKEFKRACCFSAKWLDSDEVMYFSEFHHGHETMVREAHRLFDEADVLITYNGKTFDVPHLETEMILLDNKLVPSPYQHLDLYQIVKRRFKFPSNKLDDVAKALDIGQKVSHAGFQLWIDCMNGSIEAWSKMREYNKHDVVLTEELYLILRPWIKTHPNMSILDDEEVVEGCTRCGSINYQRRGTYGTSFGTKQQFWCKDCGGWFTHKLSDRITEFRSV
jgi:DNA polymerase elongation subunit (family B)